MPTPSPTQVKRLMLNTLEDADNQIVQPILKSSVPALGKVADTMICRVAPTIESAQVLQSMREALGDLGSQLDALGQKIILPVIPSEKVAIEMGAIKSAVEDAKAEIQFGVGKIQEFGKDIMKRATPSIECAAELRKITIACQSLGTSTIYAGGVGTLASPFVKRSIPTDLPIISQIQSAAGVANNVMGQVNAVGSRLTELANLPTKVIAKVEGIATSYVNMAQNLVDHAPEMAAAYVGDRLGVKKIMDVVKSVSDKASAAADGVTKIQQSLGI